MHMRRALTFLFVDRHWWRALGIAVVLNIVPVTVGMLPLLSRFGLAESPAPLMALTTSPFSYLVTGLLAVPLSGYLLRITRQVLAGQDVPLPPWSDVTGILRDGLLLWGLVSLWGLPNALLSLLTMAAGPREQFPPTFTLGPLIAGIVSCVIVLIQPAAEARLAATGSFAAGIDVGAAMRTVACNVGGYVGLLLVWSIGMVILFGLGIGVVALVATLIRQPLDRAQTITLGIGLSWLTLGTYSWFAMAHLRAQVYAGAMVRAEVIRG